jgi:hypothetical protein
MAKRAYGYRPPTRYSGPEVTDEIMAFLSAMICLVLDHYIPGRRQDLYKMEYGQTVITLKIVPIEYGSRADRISIRIRRGDLATQLYAGIRVMAEESANDASLPAKGRVVN